MIQLTKEEIDAILAEADETFPESRCKELGYIAGATSERIKAKELVEALEKIEDITLDCYTEVEVAEIRMICQQVLLNYKP